MESTSLCRTFRITQPILNAPMGGGIAGPELVAAVSDAGGLGFLGLVALPPDYVRRQIGRTRELTRRPFGAGVVLDSAEAVEQIEVCLEERVPVLCTFWGDPQPWIADAHRRGMLVVAQVGSADEAAAAAGAGVDAVIAQGVEAGGHVRGTTPLSVLLPEVVRSAKPVPVIAAGGIADGGAVAAALRAGAQAVLMGTRFLAADEAHADRRYKEKIVAACAEDTVVTTLFDLGWPGAPHRVIRNRVFREWETAGRPDSGRRPGEGTMVGRVEVAGMRIDVPRYAVIPPLPGFDGDVDDFCLYAGESCSRIHDIRPAADIIADVMREVEPSPR